MKPDDFEQRLSRQPIREIPPAWREDILAKAAAGRGESDRGSVAELRAWLRDLLWPSPVAWGALAACWIAIATLTSATDSPVFASISYNPIRNNSWAAQAGDLSDATELDLIRKPAVPARPQSPAARPPGTTWRYRHEKEIA